jgi:hypothetical protein
MAEKRHFESYAGKQIREAMERGEFDDLAGAGKPLSGLGPVHDPEWWAKGFIRREQARARADEVRRIIRDEVPRLRAMRNRDAAVARGAELDAMVAAVNEHLVEADRIPPVDA